MGGIDIEEKKDFWRGEESGMGSASTTNTSVVEEVIPNPIGFIWPIKKEEQNEGS